MEKIAKGQTLNTLDRAYFYVSILKAIINGARVCDINASLKQAAATT